MLEPHPDWSPSIEIALIQVFGRTSSSDRALVANGVRAPALQIKALGESGFWPPSHEQGWHASSLGLTKARKACISHFAAVKLFFEISVKRRLRKT